MVETSAGYLDTRPSPPVSHFLSLEMYGLVKWAKRSLKWCFSG